MEKRKASDKTFMFVADLNGISQANVYRSNVYTPLIVLSGCKRVKENWKSFCSCVERQFHLTTCAKRNASSFMEGWRWFQWVPALDFLKQLRTFRINYYSVDGEPFKAMVHVLCQLSSLHNIYLSSRCQPHYVFFIHSSGFS